MNMSTLLLGHATLNYFVVIDSWKVQQLLFLYVLLFCEEFTSYSLLFGSTHDVTSRLQCIPNYAARVIFHIPMSAKILHI